LKQQAPAPAAAGKPAADLLPLPLLLLDLTCSWSY
jgi:hypothetical protein